MGARSDPNAATPTYRAARWLARTALEVYYRGIEVHVGYVTVRLGQRGQFEVVRCEQRERGGLFSEIVGAGPGQRQAVKGAGAAADFVQ